MNGRHQEASNIVLDSSEINEGLEYVSSSEQRNKVNSQFPKSANSSFSATRIK